MVLVIYLILMNQVPLFGLPIALYALSILYMPVGGTNALSFAI
jgi:hypothetical protein